MAWLNFLLLILMIVVGVQAEADEQDGSVRDYDEVIMPQKE